MGQGERGRRGSQGRRERNFGVQVHVNTSWSTSDLTARQSDEGCTVRRWKERHDARARGSTGRRAAAPQRRSVDGTEFTTEISTHSHKGIRRNRIKTVRMTRRYMYVKQLQCPPRTPETSQVHLNYRMISERMRKKPHSSSSDMTWLNMQYFRRRWANRMHRS